MGQLTAVGAAADFLAVNDLEKAQRLTSALVIAERELRQLFGQAVHADDSAHEIIRRETYLAIIKLGMTRPAGNATKRRKKAK